VTTADPGDKEYSTDGSSYVVWAIGRLNHNKEPMFHDIYPKGNVKLELNRKEKENNCFAFTHTHESFRYWRVISLLYIFPYYNKVFEENLQSMLVSIKKLA
jgi:hypothetical protein